MSVLAAAEALDHMVTFIDELAEFAPTDPDVLAADVVRSRFVLYTIAIIGEAARRLGPEFRAAHPEVPWGRILGMRNRIVYECSGVDYDIVAEVVKIELPALRPRLAALRAAVRGPD